MKSEKFLILLVHLAPRVPQTYAGQEEENIDTEIAHAHEAVPVAASGNRNVEEHDNDDGKAHQLAPVFGNDVEVQNRRINELTN